MKETFDYTDDVESKHLTYIGIDVQAAHKPFYYTALDGNLEEIACGHGRLADVLAYLAGQSSALVAVNGPTWIPKSGTVVSQARLFGGEQLVKNRLRRGAGVEMASRGYPVIPVPPAEKKRPIWIERSLELTAEINLLGYSPGDGSQTGHAFFETNTDAAYYMITGCVPYDSHSLEGRLQRQLLLYEFGFPLKDPMVFLEEFTRYRLRTSNVPLNQIGVAHELRALMAAATAWLVENRPETLEYVNQSSDRVVILLKEFTKK